VLVIDANLRGTYSVSNVFNVPNTKGLTDIVHEKTSLEEAVHLINNDLYVLTSSENSANPVSVLESSSMSDIIKRAEEEFEIILVHCVQLKDFTDSVVLSPCVDCMALIINEGRVKKQVVKSYLEPLKNKGVNIIGVVLNNRTYAIPEIIYRLT
jgi:Mrp family chromosome partitioning ATPase